MSHDIRYKTRKWRNKRAEFLKRHRLCRKCLPRVVLATVAVLLPLARTRGLWAIAGLGAGFLAAAVLLAPGVAAASLVVAVWATCLAVAVR